MTEEQKQEQPEEAKRTQEDAWRDVGKQFEALGESIAAAFRAAWEDETNRRYLEQAQSGLETAADEMARAVKSAAAMVDKEKMQADATKAAQSVRKASKQTLDEMQPYVALALRQTRDALQRAIDYLSEDAAAPEHAEEDGEE